jgi:hypothetical protein
VTQEAKQPKLSTGEPFLWKGADNSPGMWSNSSGEFGSERGR